MKSRPHRALAGPALTAMREGLEKCFSSRLAPSIDPAPSLKHPQVRLIYPNWSKTVLRLQISALCGIRFSLLTASAPSIDLTLHAGSADGSVPIRINKSWNILHFAVLFFYPPDNILVSFTSFLSPVGDAALPPTPPPPLRVSSCLNV